MKRILVIANPYGSQQRIIERAVALASRLQARLDVVGFVYEHLINLPMSMDETAIQGLQEGLVAGHRQGITAELGKTTEHVESSVEVYWEKRVADWIIHRVQEQNYDMVIKAGHRSETFLYTSTDWQLLRNCRAPILLLSDKRWRGGKHVMAAVDLGTKVKSKIALNYKIVESAASMATSLGCKLHIGYTIPFSKVLRDLDIVDEAQLRRDGKRVAQEFQSALADRGITIDGIHVATGAPEKVLVNLAAKNKIGLVVLGCVGRKKFVGRVLGNTAEQILRLVKADVLAIKP